MDDITTSLTTRLTDLSRNLWWTWHPEVVAIFRDVEPALWREVNHNPIAFVKRLTPEQWSRHAEETVIEIRVNRAFRRLEEYLRESGTWASRFCNVLNAQPVAYFSAEFALHESLPTYSGGLGVLAGDHLKSCSDLGVPLVGVGIFYGQGYFRQGLDINGWQQEGYGHVDVEQLPLSRVTAADGRPLVIEIPLDEGPLRIGAWRADVGRSTLLLLDSDVEGNPRDSRELTAQLYGGDQRVRIRQELLLGVGGVRMLNALGIRPGVLHLNEGYSAFAPLEIARQRATAEGVSLLAAHREVALETVFTTHTSVAAGHDRFPPGLVLEHLDWLLRETGLSADELLGLGRVDPRDAHETFCMTVLALRSSRHANGVSAIHGHVSRQMWQNLWPGRPEAEVPIGHITNGAHSPSWLAPEMFELFERHLGRDWRERMCCADVWQGIATLDDAALWEMHQVLKRRMLRYVARRVAERRRGARSRAASRRSDPDVRPALHRVQAAGHAARRPRSPRSARQRSEPRPTDHFRGEGPSAGRRGQAPTSRGLRAHSRPALPIRSGLRRGLRLRRGAPSLARERPMAEHATSAPRSLRHERSEGGAQRCSQPLRPRRLVGGRL